MGDIKGDSRSLDYSSYRHVKRSSGLGCVGVA